jgi:hypothetical protein
MAAPNVDITGASIEDVYVQEVRLHAPAFTRNRHLRVEVLEAVQVMLHDLAAAPPGSGRQERVLWHDGIRFPLFCSLTPQVRCSQ